MQFTEKEIQIIADTEFLTRKLVVIGKIQKLFEDTRFSLRNTIEKSEFQFPTKIDKKLGKIFRGENYKSLPYVVLDYPKLYSKTNSFTFRTMFWWGNFFSATLHLEGESVDKFKFKIIQNADQLLNDQIYICINDSPWQYHYEKDNYLLLTKSNLSIIKELKFIKLSKKFNLEQYSYIPALSSNFLNIVLKSLSD